MSIPAELEKELMGLPKRDRGQLASKLIASLDDPINDTEGDDGVDEALRRSRELAEDPELGITLQDLDLMIRNRFPQCVS